ncbi:hypothetical protein Q0601_22470 [Paracoccus onubensis]|uniref:hypothetical protein n=1 Tax=Paracoccus onubensis TaxID=1675788 RepID=UPI00273046C5|nr:hypothetical protein [Paracoccus onubensis]MDP0929954.1 hypothetical protein [Paracoccus onubensis]
MRGAFGIILGRAGRLAGIATSGSGRWSAFALFILVLALGFLGVWLSVRMIAWNKGTRLSTTRWKTWMAPRLCARSVFSSRSSGRFLFLPAGAPVMDDDLPTAVSYPERPEAHGIARAQA